MLLVSCGLVKMPFRVAGAVAGHSYQAGKRTYDNAARKREVAKAKKEADKETEARKAAAGKNKATPTNPDGDTPAAIPGLPPPATPGVPTPPVEPLPDLLPPLPEDLPPLDEVPLPSS